MNAAQPSRPSGAPPGEDATLRARQAVTTLYQAHALGLIRLAVVMLSDRAAAEDVVQEAFCGLYRRWNQLSDTDKALSYVRSSVINGCRSALRKRRLPRGLRWEPAGESPESAVLISEEHQEVLAAMRRLPVRQREAVVLRFYFDLGEEEIAASMRVTRSASQVTVVTLAGGASRSWSGPGNIGVPYDRGALSWTADQTRLAFTVESGPAAGEVRVLDLNRASGSLLGDSTAVLSPGQQTTPDGTRVTWQGDAIITPDGATVVTGAPSISLASGPGKSRDTTGFAEFSARTGKVTRVIVPSAAGLIRPRAVLWSDRTGRVLIVEAEFSDSLRVGVLIGNKFTPLNLTWPLQGDVSSTW